MPFLPHSLAKFLRRTRAAIIIQKYQRMYVQRMCYKRKQAAALVMQCILRAYMARQLYKAVRKKPDILIHSSHIYKYFCSSHKHTTHKHCSTGLITAFCSMHIFCISNLVLILTFKQTLIRGYILICIRVKYNAGRVVYN